MAIRYTPSAAKSEKRESKLVPVTMRLDEELVAWFKASGSGWQSRMRDVLRAYMMRMK